MEYDGESTIPLKGGGGTSFSIPFEHINDSEKFDNTDICCAVYLTDGYAPTDSIPIPEFPVLWVLVCSNPSFNPPFGEVTSMILDDL